MFADLMNSIPSIKSSILYIFDTYLGIKLNLTNFELDQDNNLYIKLNDVKLEPNQINNNYLKDINIKITKGIIEQLELRVGINTLEINLSKLSLTLMPVISINKKEKEAKIENEEKKEEITNENNINKNDKEQKGYISSFIDYYLSKLKISIDEIELIAFNYEITNKNLTLANPVIFFNLYKIKYDKGKLKETLDKSYIRKNIWENKHFSIDALCLKLCKSFSQDEKDLNKSDSSPKKNEQDFFDKDNNDNIMVINTQKGIHFYTNTKNEILGEIGDVQLIINLFQLELFKNFIDCYLLFLSLGKENDIKKNSPKKKKEINADKSNITYSNINKSVINTQSNNEIMNIKINLNTLSLIILERNQNQTEVKLNEYRKEKMNEHFCYFEENFFIFVLYKLSLQYTNKNQMTSLIIDEIGLNYIEYNSKEKKEEEIELIKRTDSEFSENNDTAIFRSNEIFKSIKEDGINVKEYYCSYDYRYEKNQILLIKNIKIDFINNIKDKNKLNFELNSFLINFHPIYLFKLLKLLFENSFLIKEVLFPNIEIINEKNKLSLSKNKSNENILIEGDNINNKNENEDNIELSLLSFEEKEEEDIIKIDDNNNNNNSENKKNGQSMDNIVYKSDLIFNNEDNEDIIEQDELNMKIKKLLEDLSFEIKIRVIEIKLNSFKCEENFYNIINPYFNEFYYEHIYIMDIKDDFKQKKLKINEISSKDNFNIMIKNIMIKNTFDEKNNNELIIVKFYPLIVSFTNNKLLDVFSDTIPIKYDLEKNEINVNIKINLFFKVKLFPYILSFINIWKYTLLLFDIFQQRMIFNYNKGKDELEEMNHEKDILKYIENYRKTLEKNKKDNEMVEYDYNINNKNVKNKLNIDIKIPLIKVEFDILPQKIKTYINIQQLELKYILNNISDIIIFSINEISSNEFDFKINSILLKITLCQIKNERFDISGKKLSRIKNKKKLRFDIVSPGESIEIYIENILRFKQKQRMLDLKLNEYEKVNETKTDLDLSIKSIMIKPLETLLFLNDIYNVIGREEIYNSNNNEKNKMLLTKSMQRISTSSWDSKKTKNKIDLISSIAKDKDTDSISIKSKENELNKKNKADLVNINLNIELIKCEILDDTTYKSTEISINNITLKNKIFNINSIKFYILYEISDVFEKVLVNICEINDINLTLTEKPKNNFSLEIIISSIIFSICKDSFSYIQTILDIISNTISNCFVQTKKGNKIVLSQKKDVLIGMRDTKLSSADDQEAEVFGNNEAKSVCLISTKNEFVLEIDEDYLDNLKNEKEEVVDNIDEIFKSNLQKNKKENTENNDLILCIKKINFGLYAGLDFESVVDIKCKSDEDNGGNNNNIEKKETPFEIIEFNPYKKINGRDNNNYLLFFTEELNLSIIYEQSNSYVVDFSIKIFEITDHLKDSNFKRLLFATKNIEDQLNFDEDENKIKINNNKNNKFMSIFVDISNSQNELSANNYSDFNIICEISLSNIQLKIHQKALLFILNFFIDSDKKKQDEKENQILKLNNKTKYHTDRAFIEDCEFNELFVENLDGVNQSDLLVDRNFFYITNFLFRKFNVNITYESNELGFRFQSIYIPLIPDLKDYDFSFNEIKYKGFVTLSQFTDFFAEHFLGQLSKSNLFLQLLKSLSWTRPIVDILGDFFDIFISPFQSYKKNQGFIHGFFKGIKKFFFNLLSKNVYAGEKMIRTLTTFIGVTKNNSIGKDSFYERYILTDEKKKIYNYFYK